MRMLLLLAGCLVLTAAAQAQQAPPPLKPNAQYVKQLRRYQKIQSQKAADQRKLDEKHLKDDIEAAGLVQYLSRVCQNGVNTGDCIPAEYGVNPTLELFVPLAKEAPKPEPAKPAEPAKP